MAHRIDYTDGGNRARIQLDLNGASLDSDANPIGSQWQTLQNVLTNLPGVLRKRGAIAASAANATALTDASGALAFHDGQKASAATYRPYLGMSAGGGSIDIYLQTEATSRTALISLLGGGGLLVSKAPTVAGWLITSGRDATNATYPNRPSAGVIYGGATGTTAAYSTGTVTLTAGSAAVSGAGTAWTSAMEGCVFSANTDTYRYAFYRVRKVVSGTSLLLDREYTGSATGAGLAYVIGSQALFVAPVSGPWGATNSSVNCKIAASCWGRLATFSTREAGAGVAVSDATPLYPSRIRWSGLIDSDEGTGSALGIFAWHANGSIDLSSRFGEGVALAPGNRFVLAFQESGLTVIRGTPVYDGAGSLDVSESYAGVSINGGFAYETTPDGVFFFDKNVGPCVYDGSRVQRIGDARVTRTMLPYGIKHVGYYNGLVLFSGETSPGIFVFDTATQQWSLQVPPAIVTSLIAGRVENDEDVVGLGSGMQVVNLANMFDNPGVAATDWTGAAFVVDVKTGKIGDALTQLRPERMYVTYRLTDLSTTNPYLSATVTTGLPDTSDSQHTFTNAATELAETVDVETKRVEINLDRDPMTQIRMLQVNGGGKLELYSVIIDCAVEGEGVSS